MKNKLSVLLILPLLFCGACSNNPTGDPGTEETSGETGQLKEFSSAKFSSKTFTYDGLPHSIMVTGAPSGTKIEYKNNVQTAVGHYQATAKLSKDGYKTKTLTAYITIKEPLKEFTGLSFTSQTINYDGQPHSLVLTGAPEGATITYSINNIVDVGTYPISATVSMEGYATKTLNATLRIKGKVFIGVTFSDQTFKFDGMAHSIFVEFANEPDNTQVVYSGNGKSSKGTYTVTAIITAPGYEKLELTATMTITDVNELPNYVFPDFYFIYDGKDIAIKNYFYDYEYILEYEENIDFTAVYKVNGVTKAEPIIKDVGTYTVSSTYSAKQYQEKTLRFKVFDCIKRKIKNVFF